MSSRAVHTLSLAVCWADLPPQPPARSARPAAQTGRRWVGRMRADPLAVQDLRLLDRELLIGEDALLVQRGEVLELRDRVDGGRGRRRRRRGLRVLLLGLVVGALLLP